MSGPPRPRALAEVVADRRLRPNDCRDCRNYEPSDTGLAFGYCRAFDAWVKLYHPPGDFYSQCRFKSIQRPKREPGL